MHPRPPIRPYDSTPYRSCARAAKGDRTGACPFASEPPLAAWCGITAPNLLPSETQIRRAEATRFRWLQLPSVFGGAALSLSPSAQEGLSSQSRKCALPCSVGMVHVHRLPLSETPPASPGWLFRLFPLIGQDRRQLSQRRPLARRRPQGGGSNCRSVCPCRAAPAPGLAANYFQSLPQH